MNKKAVVIALIVVIAGLVACLLLLRDPQEEAPPAPPAVSAAPEQTQTPVQAPDPTPLPAEGAVVPEMQAADSASLETLKRDMLPVIDAAVRCIYNSGTGYYDMEDEDFIWSVLATLCSTYAFEDPSVEALEDSVRIPAQTMRNIMAACFASRTDLPPVPEGVGVRFDEAAQSYTVELSDAGDTWVDTMEALDLGGGGYSLNAAYLSASDEDMPLLSTYSFTLMPYSGESGVEDALFPLCIVNGYDNCNVLAQIESVVEEDDTILVQLHHVQMHWQTDVEETEAYAPEIVPDPRGEETLRLFSREAVDYATLAMLLTGQITEFADAEEGFAWFEEHYKDEVLGERMLYQMRCYDGVIYSIAPLYSFYFQG